MASWIFKYLVKIVECIIAQIKPHIFNSFGPISIIPFLKILRFFCGTSSAQNGPDLCLHYLFTKYATPTV